MLDAFLRTLLLLLFLLLLLVSVFNGSFPFKDYGQCHQNSLRYFGRRQAIDFHQELVKGILL